MSIINEALKKASKELGKEGDWIPTLQDIKSPKTSLAKEEKLSEREKGESPLLKKNRLLFAVFLTVVLGCLIVFLGFKVDRYLNTKNHSLQDVIPPQSITPSLGDKTEDVHQMNRPLTNFTQTPQVSQEEQRRSRTPQILKKTPQLELTGIMMEKPPQALVNGRFIKVGDELSGAKVLSIHPDHVTFLRRGRKFKKWIY